MVIDGGMFIGHEPSSQSRAGVEDVLWIMDQNGVDKAVLASLRGIFGSQQDGADEIRKIAAAHADRIIPMAVVWPTTYISGGETIASLKKQGFRLVGLFPHYQGWPVEMHAVKLLAEETGLAGLLLQVAVSRWEDLIGVGRSLGGMTVPVLIRWVRGGGYFYVTEQIAMAKTHSNLYFDVGNVTSTGGISQMCAEIGAHRLYMSSNYPLVYERSVYYRVFTEELSSEDRRMVCGGSLEKLLT